MPPSMIRWSCFCQQPHALLADKGHNGDRLRESLLLRGVLPAIISLLSSRKTPAHPDYRCYKNCNRIECMFDKLKPQRRIAARHNKTILLPQGFRDLTAAKLW